VDPRADRPERFREAVAAYIVCGAFQGGGRQQSLEWKRYSPLSSTPENRETLALGTEKGKSVMSCACTLHFGELICRCGTRVELRWLRRLIVKRHSYKISVALPWYLVLVLATPVAIQAQPKCGCRLSDHDLPPNRSPN